MSVNVENMTALIEALESGEYAQARGCLRGGDRFCCLGVATDIAIKSGVSNLSWALDSSDEWHALHNGFDNHTVEYGVLPKPVRHWLGVNGANPPIKITPLVRDALVEVGANHLLFRRDVNDEPTIPKGTVAIAELNDAGLSFAKIAEILREAFLKGDNE